MRLTTFFHKYLFVPIDHHLLPSFQRDKKNAQMAVYNIAVKVLILGISVPLFCANPNFFVIGFFAGVIFDKKIGEVIKKVQLIAFNTNNIGRMFLFLGAFFTLPLVTSACTFFFPPLVGHYVASCLKGTKMHLDLSSQLV